MNEHTSCIRIVGLNRLDREELRSHFSAESLSFEEPKTQQGSAGDLVVTAAVFVVSLATLKMLTAWLLATRQGDFVEQTMDVVRPDGTKIRYKFTQRLDKSRAPDAQVLEQLGNWFKDDLDALKEVIP